MDALPGHEMIARRQFMGPARQVCATCCSATEPGVIRHVPWPCPSVRLAAMRTAMDELTTRLYEPLKGNCTTHAACRIVACGACKRLADKPESVVHDRDCPVYRLQQALSASEQPS